jgi:hypothetical protein
MNPDGAGTRAALRNERPGARQALFLSLLSKSMKPDTRQ